MTNVIIAITAEVVPALVVAFFLRLLFDVVVTAFVRG